MSRFKRTVATAALSSTTLWGNKELVVTQLVRVRKVWKCLSREK